MIDARGLSCPQPVILLKNAVEKTREEHYEILTDNMPCVENVCRFAANAGYQTEYKKEEGGEYRVTLTRQ